MEWNGTDTVQQNSILGIPAQALLYCILFLWDSGVWSATDLNSDNRTKFPQVSHCQCIAAEMHSDKSTELQENTWARLRETRARQGVSHAT